MIILRATLRLLVFLSVCAVTLPEASARRHEPAQSKPSEHTQKKSDGKQPQGKKTSSGKKQLLAKLAKKERPVRKQRPKKRRTAQKRHRSQGAVASRSEAKRVQDAPASAADPAEKHSNLPVGWEWPPNEAMRADGERCGARLRALGVDWRPAPPLPKIATPIEVPAREIGGVRFTRLQRDDLPLVMDCRLAEAMAVVGAPILRAAGVRELRYSSIFAERNVIRDGRKHPVLSRHALGLALDVHVFVTDDGETHVVREDYARGPLLPEIERRFDESNAFRNVLTPAKDPLSHADHFHFEARALGDPGPDPPAEPSAPDAGTDTSHAERRQD
ncbi:MAG TPA: extensin family protein [Polyangia bacterium]|nr:extensin family protein [Polyangia bacterium]